MKMTDLRYLALSVTSDQARTPAFMRGVKDCMRRRVAIDHHTYPVATGGRVRYSRRRIGPNICTIIAEWPAQREVSLPAPPVRKSETARA
jgi:hypothetical protein